MRRVLRHLLRSVICISLGLFGASTAGAAQQQPSSSVRGAVQVREVEILFDHPSGLRWVGSKFTPDRIRISEDGNPRQVTRVEPLAEAGSNQGAWRVVICLDRKLASADTINRAIAQLVTQSGRLVGLGTVEIMVADPIPHRTQAPTRDRRVLEGALQDAVRLGGEQPTATANEAVFERQLDRVVNAVSPERARLPGLLIWVTDPWPMPSPVGLWAMQGVEAMEGKTPAGSGGAVRLAAIGRLLAAERWSVAVMAPEASEKNRGERARDIGKVETSTSPGEQGERTVVLWNVDQLMAKLFGWKSSAADQQAALAAADQRLDPELAPMQLLAAATQGSLVRSENQLVNYLNLVTHRWHLFFSAPRRDDATPVPVDAEIVEDGIEYTLARTWRAGTEPLAQTRSRLRQALADGAGTLTSELEGTHCRLDIATEAPEVRLQCEAEPSEKKSSHLRISLAADGCPNAEAVQIQEIELSGGKREEPALLSLPNCARRLAVGIEDPVTGQGMFWAGAVEPATLTLP